VESVTSAMHQAQAACMTLQGAAFAAAASFGTASKRYCRCAATCCIWQSLAMAASSLDIMLARICTPAACTPARCTPAPLQSCTAATAPLQSASGLSREEACPRKWTSHRQAARDLRPSFDSARLKGACIPAGRWQHHGLPAPRRFTLHRGTDQQGANVSEDVVPQRQSLCE
jgi:hypothetical protein